MRIAYVAPYQGPTLLRQRPSLHNLSLGCRVKVQLIANLLQKSGHDIEIISQGPVDRRQLRLYPALGEREGFNPHIPIHYLSALPVKYLTGLWEATQIRRVVEARHRKRPYDVIVIYNLKPAQMSCARFARERLGLPVVLEYEDDSFVDVHGRRFDGVLARFKEHRLRKVLGSVDGLMAPSPYLLSQCPEKIPKLLLRAVVGDEIVRLRASGLPKRNWVVFSGTLESTQGLEQSLVAWRDLQPAGWEFHVAGHGPLDSVLRRLAGGDPSIVFHGFLDPQANARLLCTARIGLNAQDVTEVPGGTFAFKIVEYLAAGNHVVTTPRGTLEASLEEGITYVPDNAPETIRRCLRDLILDHGYERTAGHAALRVFGPDAVSTSLNELLGQVTAGRGRAAGNPDQ